ncbi:MAG: histidinol-phosphatase [Roseburia sp.]
MEKNKTLDFYQFQDKKANFHTHTMRCKHAAGEDKEYVERAIEAGFQVLGFSDHVPYPYKDGYVSRIRMGFDEIEDYMDSILSLRKEYENDIEIYLGFEAEYFPEKFPELIEALEPYPIEYMILGQHYLNNEKDQRYVGRLATEEELSCYANQVLDGLKSGYFSYVAHPDIGNYTKDEAVYRRYMRQICEVSKELGLPLEINQNGYRNGAWYPNSRFLTIASEVGNDMIIGVDAHNPMDFLSRQSYEECIRLGEQYAHKLICQR